MKKRKIMAVALIIAFMMTTTVQASEAVIGETVKHLIVKLLGSTLVGLAGAEAQAKYEELVTFKGALTDQELAGFTTFVLTMIAANRVADTAEVMQNGLTILQNYEIMASEKFFDSDDAISKKYSQRVASGSLEEAYWDWYDSKFGYDVVTGEYFIKVYLQVAGATAYHYYRDTELKNLVPHVPFEFQNMFLDMQKDFMMLQLETDLGVNTYTPPVVPSAERHSFEHLYNFWDPGVDTLSLSFEGSNMYQFHYCNNPDILDFKGTFYVDGSLLLQNVASSPQKYSTYKNYNFDTLSWIGPESSSIFQSSLGYGKIFYFDDNSWTPSMFAWHGFDILWGDGPKMGQLVTHDDVIQTLGSNPFVDVEEPEYDPIPYIPDLPNLDYADLDKLGGGVLGSDDVVIDAEAGTAILDVESNSLLKEWLVENLNIDLSVSVETPYYDLNFNEYDLYDAADDMFDKFTDNPFYEVMGKLQELNTDIDPDAPVWTFEYGPFINAFRNDLMITPEHDNGELVIDWNFLKEMQWLGQAAIFTFKDFVRMSIWVALAFYGYDTIQKRLVGPRG